MTQKNLVATTFYTNENGEKVNVEVTYHFYQGFCGSYWEPAEDPEVEIITVKNVETGEELPEMSEKIETQIYDNVLEFEYNRSYPEPPDPEELDYSYLS